MDGTGESAEATAEVVRMTVDEIGYLAERLACGDAAADDVPWDMIGPEVSREILVLVAYEIRRLAALEAKRALARSAGQLRARGLLRSLLSPRQRREFGKRGCVTVTGSAGGVYRLWPATGAAERLSRHGSRLYGRVRYCLHSEDRVLPPADESIAHLLLLRCDEPAFLAAANATPEGSELLWNGAYLRRLRANRLARTLAA